MNGDDLTRRTAVRHFIQEHSSVFKGNSDWNRLVSDVPKAKRLSKRWANDIQAKAILAHAYGETIATIFKRWFITHFPSLDDLKELAPKGVTVFNDGYEGVNDGLPSAA